MRECNVLKEFNYFKVNFQSTYFAVNLGKYTGMCIFVILSGYESLEVAKKAENATSLGL